MSFLCAQQHVCATCCSRASHRHPSNRAFNGPSCSIIYRKVALARVHSKITRPTRIPLPGEYNVCARAVTGACLAGSGFWAAAVYILCRRETLDSHAPVDSLFYSLLSTSSAIGQQTATRAQWTHEKIRKRHFRRHRLTQAAARLRCFYF